MFTQIDNNFAVLSEMELESCYGGNGWSGTIEINLHKTIDSVGNFFSSIYKAGQDFGRNLYNARRPQVLLTAVRVGYNFGKNLAQRGRRP